MQRSKIVKRCGGVLLVLMMVLWLGMQVRTSYARSGNDGKFLGNIIANSVPSNFSTYWNQVTPENASKWGSVESSRDNMNWSGVDTCYNYAKSKGIPFKFHTLVWGSQEPGWISGLSATEQKAEVLEWIQAAGAKYGTSDYIDVVNEPLHAKPSYKNAIGGDGATGWDWVIWSFEQARKYCSGKLIINEYGIINDTNATRNYITIINLLKSRGLVDGIGIQCHQFNIDTLSTNTMKTNLDLLAATGLPIYVSELDITGDDATQLARYKEKFPILWEHPSVKGITLWGYIEGQTWKSNTHLINSSGTERPALKWLKEYVGDTSTAPPSETPDSSLKLDSDVNVWSDGYTMSIDIKNTTNTSVDTWKLTVNKSDFTIKNIWNARVTESGNSLIITPLSWNKSISAGDSVCFGIQGAGTPKSDFSYTIE